jgi:hypothetical protein
MVSEKSVQEQLKKIGFKRHGWGKGELDELQNILLPDEEIYECVNGSYEGGFALLVATDIRLLLIDKKPMNYLTVEDLRFDMINEMDYSHRLMGAKISISAGSKNLAFRSYNQPRLRKLIGHVQHCMADAKKQQNNHQEDQKLHLEQINQQLQSYLLAQQQQQMQLQQMHLSQQLGTNNGNVDLPEPVKPSPELSDYLFAQSLLAQHQNDQTGQQQPAATAAPPATVAQPQQPIAQPTAPGMASQVRASQDPDRAQLDEMYDEGVHEVFGKRLEAPPTLVPSQQSSVPPVVHKLVHTLQTNPLEISPLRIAYSKLPMALRSRKFGRPLLRDHGNVDKVADVGYVAAS